MEFNIIKRLIGMIGDADICTTEPYNPLLIPVMEACLIIPLNYYSCLRIYII